MVYIGVDLGGTNIAIGIVNEQFEIIKKGSTPTLPERGGDAIIEDMAALSKKLLAECGLTLDDVAYAGVATPGTWTASRCTSRTTPTRLPKRKLSRVSRRACPIPS